MQAQPTPFSQDASRALSGLLEEMDSLDALGAAEVQFTGKPPAFDTRHRIVTAQAAAVAAAAATAAARWKDVHGESQGLSVDALEAACSLNPCWYQRQNGHSISPFLLSHELKSAFYETADHRWFYPSGSYAHLRDGALELLDCPNTSAAIAKAISRWRGHELEEAFHARGLTGVYARTPDEWRAHPQGRIQAGIATVSIERIGDSPAEKAACDRRPLDDIRVLDMSHVIAGPVVARTLAEHGADVLRISSALQPDPMPMAVDTGIGKRNANIDLTRPRDVQVARELAGGCDVFVQSWRPTSLAKRGFGPQDVARLRPGVVYVSVSCFGMDGPWGDRKGFEQLGQAVSGIAHDEGDGGRARVVPTHLLNDYLTGYLGAAGAMAALRRRARDGGSYHVKVALARSSMWIQGLGLQARPTQTVGLDELRPRLEQRSTPYGVLEQMPPVACLTRTPAHWALPTAPLGAHAPAWPARATRDTHPGKEQR